MDFLENHLDYRVKLVILALIIAGGVVLWSYVKDLQTAKTAQQAQIATLQQNFQQLGTSAVTQNQLQTQAQATAAAQQAFGQQVTDYMKQSNSTIVSLTTTLGNISSSVNGLQQQVNSFTPKQQVASTGALTGYSLEENRGKLPPTAAVNLFYDPKQVDPNKAFLGTTWTHYNEAFTGSVGEWVSDKTHGFKTTVTASRTITKQDPNDPTKMLVVGTEDIPITSGNTIYPPAGIALGTATAVPRWTATVGFSRDSFTSTASGYSPSALLDYRITDKFGATAGVVSKSPFLGLSIRFGGVK
jgi:hypothetical protein